MKELIVLNDNKVFGYENIFESIPALGHTCVMKFKKMTNNTDYNIIYVSYSKYDELKILEVWVEVYKLIGGVMRYRKNESGAKVFRCTSKETLSDAMMKLFNYYYISFDDAIK